MRYLHAVDRAAARVRARPQADHVDLYAALQLALHGWRHCAGYGAAMTDWDLFGTDVHHVVETLYPAAEAIVVLVDEDPLPDTAAVRAGTAALTAAVAACLHDAGADPTAAPARRWAWTAAAARLDRAAAELGGPP